MNVHAISSSHNSGCFSKWSYRTIAEAISGEVNDRFRDHLINVLRSLLSERIVARDEVETFYVGGNRCCSLVGLMQT